MGKYNTADIYGKLQEITLSKEELRQTINEVLGTGCPEGTDLVDFPDYIYNPGPVMTPLEWIGCPSSGDTNVWYETPVYLNQHFTVDFKFMSTTGYLPIGTFQNVPSYGRQMFRWLQYTYRETLVDFPSDWGGTDRISLQLGPGTYECRYRSDEENHTIWRGTDGNFDTVIGQKDYSSGRRWSDNVQKMKFFTIDGTGGGNGCRIYYYKQYDENGNLICDILPYLVDGEACFYDSVSQTLLHNLGTGTPEYQLKA